MQGKTNIRRVYEFICDMPSTSQQVADALGISLEEVKSAIRGLKVNELIYQAVIICIRGPRAIWCEVGEQVSNERIEEVRRSLERAYPSKKGGMKEEIYRYLAKNGPKMVFEIVNDLRQNQESVRKMINRMLKNGEIRRVGQGRTAGGLASYQYEACPGGLRGSVVISVEVMPVEHQKMLTVRERIGRVTLADKTVKAMKAAFVPGRFDPFFSLRCQLVP
jgi:DNA-binding Lrp family transcriptional regulator